MTRSPKMHERRIAIAFSDVAEHLIIGAVFLDDINHVFENAGFADTFRDWPSWLIRAGRLACGLHNSMPEIGQGGRGQDASSFSDGTWTKERVPR